MITAKDLLLKQIPEDCLWLEVDKLVNCPIEAVTKAMVEFAQLKVQEALQTACDKVEVGKEGAFGIYWNRGDLVVDNDSILNCYPKENIQ